MTESLVPSVDGDARRDLPPAAKFVLATVVVGVLDGGITARNSPSFTHD